MRPLAAMGALNRVMAFPEPSAALVKIACPVSALNACSWRSPPAPTAQMIASAPLPVVLEIGEPFPLTLAHQAVVIPGGDPAAMRRATNPFVPLGQELPLAGKARIVPEGVPITVGAVITTPPAT